MVNDRLMIFHPSENSKFIINNGHLDVNWNGEFIGEVSNFLNKLPSVRGTKLFVMYPSNRYVVLQKYDTKTHIIELIKRIYEMPMIPYVLCKFKNKDYIMYQYIPFNEIQYTLWKKKKDEITDEERVIFFLHWMLGVRGKFISAYHKDRYITLSNGKYSNIDYEKTEMKPATINKFFGTYRNFQRVALFFNDDEKMDAIRSLMTTENYWWFQEIQRRVISHIVPKVIRFQLGSLENTPMNQDSSLAVSCQYQNGLSFRT